MFNRFSTYGSPVNIRFPQGFKLPPQDFILGILRRRVLFHNTFSYGANVLQQLPVAYNIRNLQIESDAALLRTFKITGATQFQIGLGYFETIISAYHDFQSFPGVLRQLIIRHQNTIRLLRSTSYPTTQLMQLRKPETFCISTMIFSPVSVVQYTS